MVPAASTQVTGTAATRREARRRVMGSEAHVVTVGDGPDPEEVLDGLAELEHRWSRFDPGSELSRLGRSAGRPAVASPETCELVGCCVEAWHATAGRFDPTVIAALESLGYDRDFDRVPAGTHPPGLPPPGPAPGLGGVGLDRSSGLVWLPEGVRIDPGGLGKGLAADLTALDAVRAGADGYGLLVSVGGDLRVAGAAPREGWEVEVDHLRGPGARLNLRSGGLATSSVLRRRWTGPEGTRHHVLDPRTGRPAVGPVVSVSVVAAAGWWAEVLATVLLLDGGTDGAGVSGDLLAGAGAFLTLADGTTTGLGPLAGSFVLARPVRSSPGRRPAGDPCVHTHEEHPT